MMSMMRLRGVLEFAFYLAFKYPPALAAAAVGWVPDIAASVVTSYVFSTISLGWLVQNFGLFGGLLTALNQVGGSVLLLFILYWMAGAFLQTFYIEVTEKFSQGTESPSLSESLTLAKEETLPMMGLHALVGLMALAAGGFVALAFGILYVTAGFGIGVVSLGIALFMGAAVAVYVLLRNWLAPVALILEEETGVDAILRSFELTKGYFWHIVTVVVVILGIQTVVIEALRTVPVVSLSLILLASLFFTVWSYTAPPAFYYQYELGEE